MNRKRVMGQSLALMTGGALALSGCGGDGAAGAGEETTLVLTSPSGEDQHPDLQEWLQLITERTAGAVQFETHYDGSLCSLAETSDCVGDGRADVGFASASYYPGDFPISQIGAMPFQTHDIQAQGEAMQNLYDEVPEMREEFDAVNQHLLYFSPVGPHQVAMSEQVENLSDMSGMSIRSTGGQSVNLSVLGANPVAIAPAEVYESVQRGVLDGASYPLELAAQSKVGEVAPYFHDTGIHTGSMVIMHWTMNLDTWESLSPEVQDVFTETSEEILSDIVTEYVIPANEQSCEAVEEVGGEFITIGTEAEGEQWKEEALPQHMEEWTNSVQGVLDDPEAFHQRYQELLTEYASGEERTPGQICRDLLS